MIKTNILLEVFEMGSRVVVSDAAKYYAAREKVLGAGITLLKHASEKIDSLSKEDIEAIGDIAAALLPHAPGYAGKLVTVVARLFWALAGINAKEMKYVELEDLEKQIEEMKKKI
jgi:hypothetical protein